MKIRTANATDFFQVRNLIQLSEQSRVENFPEIFAESSDKQFTIEKFKQRITDSNASFLVAEYKSNIMGIALVRKAFYPQEDIFRDSEYALLDIFYVNPDLFNASVIKNKLFAEVKNWADHHGFYHLETQVYPPDNNFDFFQKADFKPFYHRLKLSIREKPKGETIFHITDINIWESAELAGIYETPSLKTEGFIHCCTDSQIEGVMSRYYQGKSDLILLEINPDLLEVELKFEVSTDNEKFPHLYGALNTNAVISVYDLEIEG